MQILLKSKEVEDYAGDLTTSVGISCCYSFVFEVISLFKIVFEVIASYITAH